MAKPSRWTSCSLHCGQSSEKEDDSDLNIKTRGGEEDTPSSPPRGGISRDDGGGLFGSSAPIVREHTLKQASRQGFQLAHIMQWLHNL